jgi:hypothetical protein
MRSRKSSSSTAAIVLGALLAALIGGPAVAGSAARDGSNVAPTAAMHRPDGRVRLQRYSNSYFPPPEVYSNPWTGNNIYNTTATGQRVTTPWYDTSPGILAWTFGISVQNDGTAGGRFKVVATGATRAGWQVRFFHGTTNITSAVVAGTFRTPPIAAGATYLIKAKLTRAEDGFYSGDIARLVTLTSVADPTKKDAVRLVVKLQTCGC